MTQGKCPSCGAMVEFTAGSAQVVVCGHCQTVVARKGADFESHGKIGAILASDSPLRLGAEGRFQGKPYRLVGHLQKDHGAGPWDEWYVEFDDGRTGWLSESEGAFHLLFAGGVEEGVNLGDLRPGKRLRLRERAWVVEERGHGRVVAAEGQLPSDIDPTEDSRYVDATGPKGILLTLDFGAREHDPEVFFGEQLKLEQLGIPPDQLRPRARKVELKQARCTQCNGPLELRAPDKSLRVACPYCGALLDASKGKLSFLRLLEKPSHPAVIPLGTKGTLQGVEWVCIGFLERSCTVDGTRYPWEEYLLYSPARGFTWLMQSTGHWVFLKPLAAGDVSLVPQVTAYHDGRRFKAFQSVTAVTEAVMGEFYWEVTAGEQAEATEYVSAPYSINTDATEDEVTYTFGEYLEPEVVRKAFGLQEKLASPRGIAPSQPNPYSAGLKSSLLWMGIWMVGLLALAAVFSAASLGEDVLQQQVTVPVDAAPGTPTAMNFSPVFELRKRGNLRVKIISQLDNTWLGVQGDLVNQDTGDVASFYQELSYYHGRDSDGSWSEGSNNDTTYLAPLPAGKYVLRTTASFDPAAVKTTPLGQPTPRMFNVFVTHDTPNWVWFWVALVLLGMGPAWGVFRSSNFETRRWSESNLSGSS